MSRLSLVAKPETAYNVKWPLKVIYFGATEEPPRNYIAQVFIVSANFVPKIFTVCGNMTKF